MNYECRDTFDANGCRFLRTVGILKSIQKSIKYRSATILKHLDIFFDEYI